MQKTLLIPTDFSVTSLNGLRLALEQMQEDQSVHVVLMYSEWLEDSITELLFYSPKKRIESLKSVVFEEALVIIQNRFENRIASIRIELFHGYNTNAFHSFAEANQIDQVFALQDYAFKPAKRGFDPIPLIKKSKFPIHFLAWKDQGVYFDENQLQLLLSHI
ncbi:MAG: hypothetical protein SFV55_14455 [Haliscomenobacter sp.]|uniref:hypothetical protein n=1 Tax=Haliscomenobacter sp. TaxID=2717303 RepID=UPI0029B7D038|nr:hypothetical protein [Haliscomenobacter sp.]MDX2069626.1 hypothetical protein [Haliscomenobacter sp.]